MIIRNSKVLSAYCAAENINQQTAQHDHVRLLHWIASTHSQRVRILLKQTSLPYMHLLKPISAFRLMSSNENSVWVTSTTTILKRSICVETDSTYSADRQCVV